MPMRAATSEIDRVGEVADLVLRVEQHGNQRRALHRVPRTSALKRAASWGEKIKLAIVLTLTLSPVTSSGSQQRALRRSPYHLNFHQNIVMVPSVDMDQGSAASTLAVIILKVPSPLSVLSHMRGTWSLLNTSLSNGSSIFTPLSVPDISSAARCETEQAGRRDPKFVAGVSVFRYG